MNRPIIVCPFAPELISGLGNQALVVHTENIEESSSIASCVNRTAKLHAISLECDMPLSALPLNDAWRTIPLAMYLPSLGSFEIVFDRLTFLRESKARIFLDAGKSDNLRDVQILSSLGVWTGVYFGAGAIDWDRLNSLMHYAIYGKAGHAPIEPFHYISANYNPEEMTDLRNVYFADPRRFLYCDAEGHVAVNRQEAKLGNFICNAAEIDRINENPAYQERLSDWRRFFLEQTTCAACVGWRICLGVFSGHYGDHRPQCRALFEDCMDGADFKFAERQQNEGHQWRL